MGRDVEVFNHGVAVVTGAGAGIGAGLSRRLGSLGMTVVVTDVDLRRAQAVVDEIKSAGGLAEALCVDVSKPHELDSLAEQVYAKHGDVRVLINNAGIETIGYVWEIPIERWESTLDINIHGVVHGVRAFAPRMLASGKEAWIANLASMGAFGIMPCQTAYIMTKHAIQSFSECLYLEMQLKKAPIHVCSIMPGMLKTSIFEEAAGAGEPESASAHRKKMFEMMRDYGMDLAQGCEIILDQVAQGKFWVHSQPEMSMPAIEDRIAFFKSQNPPVMNEAVRDLVD